MKQHLGRELNLVPAQIAQFGRSQSVPEGQEDRRYVSVTIHVALGRLDQAVDLAELSDAPGS